jgi:putative glutamine amidotransferase
MDHRAPEGLGITAAYERRAHPVIRKSGGILEKIGAPGEFMVNTVHENGVDRLGQGLIVEAEAPDGIIEAFSMPGKRFVFGTQWHPEGDCHVSDCLGEDLQGFRSGRPG